MRNVNLGVYDPGKSITGRCHEDVTGKRCLAIAGDRDGGNISVAHASAGGRIAGVSAHDQVEGDLVGVLRGNSRVVYVEADSDLVAFEQVEVGSDGRVTAHSDGVAVGYAITGASSGDDAEISLY